MPIGQSYHRTKVAPTWDAIVIGSGIGGLTAAAFLARAGQRVLVLERHSTAGGATQTFRRNGYEWDAGLHYIGQVHRPTSGLRRIFDYISNHKLRWQPMDDVYNTIVVGDNRYDYPSGETAFAARMKEYFPHDTAAIDRYLELVTLANRAGRTFFAHRALPPAVAATAYNDMCAEFRGYSDRTVAEVLADLTDNTELAAVLAGHCGDYSLSPADASFAVHAMLIHHYIDGASYPVGGSSILASTITDVITQAGGAVLVAAAVAAIDVDDADTARGVRMTDGRTFTAPCIISDAGALNTLTNLLPREAADPQLIGACEAVGPSLPWVVLNIGVKRTAAELALPTGNIWVHPSADIAGDLTAFEHDPTNRAMPMTFLTYPSGKDPSWDSRHPGRATIDIAGVTSWSLFEPFTDTTWMNRGPEYGAVKTRLTEELLDVVYRFSPQLRGQIDYTELATPLSFNHFLGRSHGDFMSLAASPARFAITTLGAHGGPRNLYLAGQDVAAAGVVGAAQGGVLAASAALGRNVLDDIGR
ncbi:FAD-dependent oxidoreductase [Rhodococcus sp. CUA-806]|jgi:all-trans-retinol 13,14-reductase|nr:FAD-dependent oxidoreductase [Rhodococcus sp. CUA-806]OLT34992.1 FAD-dependent oxidoreductase [Rhodococcus sp. CUA-806]